MILRVLTNEQKRRRKQAIFEIDIECVDYENGDMIDTEWSMEQEKKD
jgi:hypothetical protein